MRLGGFDYAAAGAYFVTLCIEGREPRLGQVCEEGMIPNTCGEMVHQCWLALSERFDNLILDEFIAMPDHVHGILILTDNRGDHKDRPYATGDWGDHEERPHKANDRGGYEDHRHLLSRPSGAPTRRGESCIRPTVNGHGPRAGAAGTAPGTLGRIIQAYKSITTHRYILGVRAGRWPEFQGKFWQRNYYDHIVRNEQDLADIRDYIRTNPVRWRFRSER